MIHERTVALDENVFRIVDRILGSGRHHVRLTLQFAPGLSVEGAERHWRVASECGSAAVVDVAGPLLAARVEQQTVRPGPGAVSLRYNEILAAPALLLEGGLALPAEVVSTITITNHGRLSSKEG